MISFITISSIDYDHRYYDRRYYYHRQRQAFLFMCFITVAAIMTSTAITTFVHTGIKLSSQQYLALDVINAVSHSIL